MRAGLKTESILWAVSPVAELTMLWIYRHQIWPRADSAQH